MVKWRQIRRPIFNHRRAAFADEIQLSLTHSRDFLVIIQYLSEILVDRQTTGDSQGTRNTLSFGIKRDRSVREPCYLFLKFTPQRELASSVSFFLLPQNVHGQVSTPPSQIISLSFDRSIDHGKLLHSRARDLRTRRLRSFHERLCESRHSP